MKMDNNIKKTGKITTNIYNYILYIIYIYIYI